ncbi:MAG: hypothetical protein ACRERC_22045 [Candidatus Binatia bacterium]
MLSRKKKTMRALCGVRFTRGPALWASALLLVLGGNHLALASLSTPDAMVYGRVSVSGQPAPGAVVSAETDGGTLSAYAVGTQTIEPDFYSLRIPISQLSEVGEEQPGGSAMDGSSVRLLIDGMLFGEVVIRSGRVVRQDISTGEALCSGGSSDGQACVTDADCAGGGSCVIAAPLCDGGPDDGNRCECIGSTCSNAIACPANGQSGTCAGGMLQGTCCDTALNCAGGAACTGTQRVCESGANKGNACLNSGHCGGAPCVSTGFVCNGGGDSGRSCVDDDDCSGGGTCSQRILTPTPVLTPTRTLPPTPTPTPGGEVCNGDCNGNGAVAINELVTLVSIALGNQPIDRCISGDVNENGQIAINELIAAVNRALNGCNG